MEGRRGLHDLSALRVAELSGYSSVSAFARDAILDKIKSTASAMTVICNERYSNSN